MKLETVIACISYDPCTLKGGPATHGIFNGDHLYRSFIRLVEVCKARNVLNIRDIDLYLKFVPFSFFKSKLFFAIGLLVNMVIDMVIFFL